MIKIYRAARQWNQWLTEPLGQSVLSAEKNFLTGTLATYYGKQAVLIGVPHQAELLRASVIAHPVLVTPLPHKNGTVTTIESDFYELPILPGSVDLVFLPHSLEYLDNPRQLLTEACRLVKPEGHIVILGFNPVSLWGLKKTMTHQKGVPWCHHFIQPGVIKKWLGLADFEWIKQDFILYGLPWQGYLKSTFFERAGHATFKPLGGVYILMAKARVTPLTPIRLRWEQTFSNMRVKIPRPS
ncbi:MAG TPA: class I SAM-dependent methyltransferase [Gammaproteobacteria bacterium]|nr:class I SAM-dependent methyltransferase [Gammaproteobacteria bacterium]